jgi:isopenicillin-N epimerase
MNNNPKILKTQFQINPDITFLNHGSYGACPLPVFENYQKWQELMERDPVKFMTKDVYKHLKISRNELSKFVNCDKDDIVYFPNPTHAVANIISNISINPGDQVLTTNLEYGSCDRMWFFHANQNQYEYKQSEIKLPIEDDDSFLDNFWKYSNSNTKYIFISHITSGTGMILPIEKIMTEAKKRGIRTIIDGAHVPGHIDLDIKKLDPDYYVGACHKWLCSPKGVSFLYIKRELQDEIQPYLKSWGWGEEFPEFKNSTEKKTNSRFQNIFQWQGTRDMSAFICVPAAIEFQKLYKWAEIRDRCNKMIIDARNRITEITKIPKICPDEYLGQMTTIIFPFNDHIKLKETLYNDYNIEIPTYTKDGYTAFRISLQGYNNQRDVDILIDALTNILK